MLDIRVPKYIFARYAVFLNILDARQMCVSTYLTLDLLANEQQSTLHRNEYESHQLSFSKASAVSIRIRLIFPVGRFTLLQLPSYPEFGLFPTSQRSPSVFITRTNRLIIFRKMILVYVKAQIQGLVVRGDIIQEPSCI